MLFWTKAFYSKSPNLWTRELSNSIPQLLSNICQIDEVREVIDDGKNANEANLVKLSLEFRTLRNHKEIRILAAGDFIYD